MPNRTPMRRTRKNARAHALPDRTVYFLLLMSGALFTVYVGLVIFTITLATVQTSLAAEVRETEGTIASLETNYYAAVAVENEAQPASVGLVAPTSVVYATEKLGEGISFARN